MLTVLQRYRGRGCFTIRWVCCVNNFRYENFFYLLRGQRTSEWRFLGFIMQAKLSVWRSASAGPCGWVHTELRECIYRQDGFGDGDGLGREMGCLRRWLMRCGRDTHCWRLDWVRTDTDTDRQTDRQTKVKTVYRPVSLRSLSGYNEPNVTDVLMNDFTVH